MDSNESSQSVEGPAIPKDDLSAIKNPQRPAKRRLQVQAKEEVPPYLVVPDDLPAYREVPGDDNWEVEEIIDYKFDAVSLGK